MSKSEEGAFAYGRHDVEFVRVVQSLAMNFLFLWRFRTVEQTAKRMECRVETNVAVPVNEHALRVG